MRARILRTGNAGCMKNEIVLNASEAFAVKELIKEAIEKDDIDTGMGLEESGNRQHWEEFIRMFDMAFTIPARMQEDSLEHLY